MTGRRFLQSAAAVGAAVAYRQQRRRCQRLITADPEWSELQKTMRSTRVDVSSPDGTRLHAEILGPEGAPTILLVHGWCCAVRFWHYQLRDLAGDYRLVAYDLRGHGRSERPTNRDYSTDALAADLHAVLQTCVPAGEAVVVAGHSMGGMSLVAWAGAHPGEVRSRLAGAVLVDTGMGQLVAKSRIVPHVPLLTGVRTALGRLLLGLPLPVLPPPDPIGYFGIRFIALSRRARPAHAAFCAQMVADCPPRVRAAFGRTLARLALIDCLPSLVVPTVVLVGSEDVLTPPEQAEIIAEEVAGAELVELPGRGHMAPVEGNEEVTAHIRAMAERTLRAR
jgi:pimeloyl-ACP methyl ester carboxylesterase